MAAGVDDMGPPGISLILPSGVSAHWSFTPKGSSVKPPMRPLTTTSYAVLGLLAVRPRSAYDLVRQIKRSNVRLIWPRAESKLYEEPKTLVAHGLASAAVARTGARRRRVYRITPRGRHALRRWLDAPGAALLLEFESMVKVVYGDFGTKEQLLTNIRRIR